MRPVEVLKEAEKRQTSSASGQEVILGSLTPGVLVTITNGNLKQPHGCVPFAKSPRLVPSISRHVATAAAVALNSTTSSGGGSGVTVTAANVPNPNTLGPGHGGG